MHTINLAKPLVLSDTEKLHLKNFLQTQRQYLGAGQKFIAPGFNHIGEAFDYGSYTHVPFVLKLEQGLLLVQMQQNQELVCYCLPEDFDPRTIQQQTIYRLSDDVSIDPTPLDEQAKQQLCTELKLENADEIIIMDFLHPETMDDMHLQTLFNAGIETLLANHVYEIKGQRYLIKNADLRRMAPKHSQDNRAIYRGFLAHSLSWMSEENLKRAENEIILNKGTSGFYQPVQFTYSNKNGDWSRKTYQDKPNHRDKGVKFNVQKHEYAQREVEALERNDTRTRSVEDLELPFFAKRAKTIVTEHAQGKSLASLISQSQKPKPKDLIEMVVSLAEALVKLRDNNIIYRDLNLNNLIAKGNTIRIIDMGHAVIYDNANELPMNISFAGSPFFVRPVPDHEQNEVRTSQRLKTDHSLDDFGFFVVIACLISWKDVTEVRHLQQLTDAVWNQSSQKLDLSGLLEDFDFSGYQNPDEAKSWLKQQLTELINEGTIANEDGSRLSVVDALTMLEGLSRTLTTKEKPSYQNKL